MTQNGEQWPVRIWPRQKGVSELAPSATAVGYARISTDDQTTALQLDALERADVDRIFTDQASGAIADRPQLAAALAQLAAGDTLVVWRLDRLGRSLRHLCEVSDELRGRGIYLRSLTEGFDTATSSGRLLYQILGAVAEFERESIRERTVAGMRSARKRGQHVGRPKVLGGSRLEKARELLAAGETPGQVARFLAVSRSTLLRAIRPA